jgi:EmrB/QacA subfamily drug resistance transporter
VELTGRLPDHGPSHVHGAAPTSPWLGLAVISTAMFVSSVDTTIVNVALPEISRDLDASTAELQWVMDAYLVALAGLLLVTSGLADRFGRRRLFLMGFALFAAGSIGAAFATSGGTLIAARAVMGAGAAAILPTALSLIAVLFEPEQRSRAIGIWSAVAGLGAALGPVLGGVLVEAAGWQAVFLVNVPFALVAIPVGRLVLPESTRPGTPPLDLLGAALSAVALTGIVFALIEGDQRGWTSAPVLVALVLGLAAAAAFTLRCLRRKQPLFDVRVLGRRRVASGAGGIFVLYATMFGALFILPSFLQYVQLRTTLVSGVALLPLGIGIGLGGPLSPRVVRLLGRRAAVAGGLAVMAVALVPLLTLTVDLPLAVVMLAIGLFGFSFGVSITAATTVVLNDLPVAKAGDGGAVNQLARQVGAAFGVAIIGSVLAVSYANQVETDLGSRLTASERTVAEQSIEGARQVASEAAPADRAVVRSAADDAFDLGGRLGLGVCVGLLVVAAIGAAIGLRPRPDG